MRFCLSVCHVQRMKWLRSIDSSELRSRDQASDCSDDAEQSTEHKEPERDVLCRLEQNHTTVDVRARRLAYCPRLLKHAPKGLLAMLQSPYKKRLVHHGVRFSMTIFHSLFSASGSRLAKLGDPQLSPHTWARCMRECPWMMKRLADGFLRSHAKASPVTSSTSLPTKSFSCGTCGKQFPTLQAALMSGPYTGADRLEPTTSTKAADAHSVQPHTFHTTLRAIKHVASVAACGDGLASGDFEKIPEAHRTKLDSADRVEARVARKSGISV